MLYFLAVGTGALLAGAFVALTFFPCGCPVGEVTVHGVDRSFVTRLRHGHGVDLRFNPTRVRLKARLVSGDVIEADASTPQGFV